MLDKYILTLIGIESPNPRIEVSKLYYERKYGDAPPNTIVDLLFAAILQISAIPLLAQHDAFNDALMSAMMYVKLRDLKDRGVRIARPRTTGAIFNPIGRIISVVDVLQPAVRLGQLFDPSATSALDLIAVLKAAKRRR